MSIRKYVIQLILFFNVVSFCEQEAIRLSSFSSCGAFTPMRTPFFPTLYEEGGTGGGGAAKMSHPPPPLDLRLLDLRVVVSQVIFDSIVGCPELSMN